MAFNDALKKEWQNAGYKSGMGSAAVTHPPPEDFIRLYHITAAAYGISSIALGRLKVARFSDVNDPFELLALNFKERRTRKVVKRFKSTYNSHTGLLCFSADWTNPVLWSHYGAQHRGICLGFDVERVSTQKVHYKDDRILAELDEEENPFKIDGELQELLLRTKSRYWRYEEEHRVFVPLKNAIKEESLHFCRFDRSLKLSEVILGPQCSLSLHAVRQLAQTHHPHAVTFRARLAFKSFRVVPNERTVP